MNKINCTKDCFNTLKELTKENNNKQERNDEKKVEITLRERLFSS